jgi:D-glycero-D-manno-heptose 1,7-bisphosphate phosphatase
VGIGDRRFLVKASCATVNKAVFLDRDGVINRAIVRSGRPYPPKDLSELEVFEGVLEALTALKSAKFMLIVVTNQPDVARGTTEKYAVETINRYLKSQLPLDEFRTCYHDDDEGCDCRKPAPGALLAAAKDHGIDMGSSYMVGDRWRDIEAGQRAGCKTIFIDYGYSERQPTHVDYTVQSLKDAMLVILGVK